MVAHTKCLLEIFLTDSKFASGTRYDSLIAVVSNALRLIRFFSFVDGVIWFVIIQVGVRSVQIGQSGSTLMMNQAYVIVLSTAQDLGFLVFLLAVVEHQLYLAVYQVQYLCVS